MASRSRSRRGGGGGTNRHVAAIGWFIVIAAMVFAFFQVPYDPGAKGIIEIVKSKSENVQAWVEGIAPAFENKINEVIRGGSENPGVPGAPGTGPSDNGTGGTGGTGGGTDNGSGSGTVPVSEAETKLNTLTVANESNAKYDRDEWKHWNSIRSCWDVREQVLAVEAVAGSLVLKDKEGNATTDINTACSIVSGQWNDPYTGKTFTNPKDLDIDHMIPLNYAAQHNGQGWDSKKKSAYANNLDYPNHLIAVDKSANRSKSDKGPSEWKPSNQAYWCQYSQDWINISSTWGLSVTQGDVKALKEMLATCPA